MYQIRNIEWLKVVLNESRTGFANTHSVVSQMGPAQLQANGVINQAGTLETLRNYIQIIDLTLQDLENDLPYEGPTIAIAPDTSGLPPISEGYGGD